MGRPPKPTALHRLEGTLREDRHGGRRAEPRPRAGAEAPTWLTREAKREWRRIAPELERLGLLTLVDRAVLAAYCEAWSRLYAATKAIRAKGVIVEGLVNPAVHVASRATDQIVRLAGELGLSPSARAGIEVAVPKDAAEAKEPDSIEDFLKRRQAAEQRAASAPTVA